MSQASDRAALRADLDRAVRTVGDDLTERRAAVGLEARVLAC